ERATQGRSLGRHGRPVPHPPPLPPPTARKTEEDPRAGSHGSSARTGGADTRRLAPRAPQGRALRRSGLHQVAHQLVAARLFELHEPADLDLPDPLAGQVEDLADLLEGDAALLGDVEGAG